MYSNPFHTTGSGSLAAMAILETGFKEGMTKEEAIHLVVAAIEAGVYHDLGSGSNVDVCIITRGKHEMLRNYKHDNKKVYSKPSGYTFSKDRIVVTDEVVYKITQKVAEDNSGVVPMELS